MGTELTFADLLAPLTVEKFFEDFHGRRWAHIEGEREKFGDLMPWDRFNELLGMTSKWTGETLRLHLDGAPVPLARYCENTGAGVGADSMRPVPPEVMGLLRQGATLKAHHLDTASPGIACIADALELELGTKVDCSLTCAWQGRPGVQTHFEVFDMFVVQLHGEQRWSVSDQAVQAPVPDAGFLRGVRPLTGGEKAEQVTTRPGDILYMPRGRYHDAVSPAGASMHLAFGAQAFTGLELLQTIMVQAVQDPVFRRNFPRAQDGREAFARHLSALGEQVRATVADPDFVARFAAYQGTLRTVRSGYSLPVDVDAKHDSGPGAGNRAEAGQERGNESNG